MRESRFNVWVDEGGDGRRVYNGASGQSVDVSDLDHSHVQAFVDGQPVPQSVMTTLERLVRAGVLVRDGFDEVLPLAAKYRASREDRDHFSLVVVTSLGCNFDCPYCFEAKHPSIMQPKVQEAVLAALDDQLPHISRFSVTWYGGEPLVGKRPLLELSDRFIDRCEAHGVRYAASIITNGSLLDDATCAELRDRRVTWAQITLDGPPDIHDRMRPLAGGRGTFWDVLTNIERATGYMQVSVRINVDQENFARIEELLQILADRGLADKVGVGLGQLTASGGAGSPGVSYQPSCFTSEAFAEAETRFWDAAARFGFDPLSVPSPLGAPCTAVRRNEYVVGSRGELYKCFESVGDPREVVGNITDYTHPNSRVHKWLRYDPFTDPECRQCVALPVCMGGCAHHALDTVARDSRCDTFRYNHRERITRLVAAGRLPTDRDPVPLPLPTVRAEKSR